MLASTLMRKRYFCSTTWHLFKVSIILLSAQIATPHFSVILSVSTLHVLVYSKYEVFSTDVCNFGHTFSLSSTTVKPRWFVYHRT